MALYGERKRQPGDSKTEPHKNKRHVTVFGGIRHVVMMHENLRFIYILEHHVPNQKESVHILPIFLVYFIF